MYAPYLFIFDFFLNDKKQKNKQKKNYELGTVHKHLKGDLMQKKKKFRPPCLLDWHKIFQGPLFPQGK